MTVVVYRDGIMAADTGAWRGKVLATVEQKKIIRLSDGSLLGTCGDDCEVQVFRRWAEDGFTADKPFERAKDDQFSAVLVSPGGSITIWHEDLWSYVAYTEPYAFIGAHNEFLAGALAAGLTATSAVRLAIEHCAWARGEVFSMELEETVF